MTNFAHGRAAEAAAADYLRRHGYKILTQNWRTKYCEIDIVASRKNIIYFVEVKYRQSGDQGEGLDYVTPKKLKQLCFAAEIWVADNNWSDDYMLGVIEVSGSDYQVTEFITSID